MRISARQGAFQIRSFVVALALALWLILPAAKADPKKVLLFVNLNHSASELEAARDTAKKQGLELKVIPDPSIITLAKEHKRAADELLATARRFPQYRGEALSVFWLALALQDEDTDKLPTPLRQAWEHFEAQKELLSTAERSSRDIQKQLEDALQSIRDSGGSLDTVILSGHSDGSEFSGDSGLQLREDSLDALRERFPDVLDQPRHLLLMGCYSKTDVSTIRWRAIFPGTRLIAGFAQKAPLESRAQSAMYIREVLAAADHLNQKVDNAKHAQTVTEKDIKKIFSQLASFQQTTAALEYCSVVVEQKKKLSCIDRRMAYGEAAKEVTRRYFGPNPIEPPKKPAQAELRTLYDAIQGACPEELEFAREEWERSRASTIRLMNWEHVQTNYRQFFLREFVQGQTALDQLGCNVQLPALDGRTLWNDFRKKSEEAIACIEDRREKLEEKIRQESIAFQPGIPYGGLQLKPKSQIDQDVAEQQSVSEAEKLSERLSELRALRPSIPLAWIEPDAVRKEPARKPGF